MNERFIYLLNRIVDELNKIDLATQLFGQVRAELTAFATFLKVAAEQ